MRPVAEGVVRAALGLPGAITGGAGAFPFPFAAGTGSPPASLSFLAARCFSCSSLLSAFVIAFGFFGPVDSADAGAALPADLGALGSLTAGFFGGGGAFAVVVVVDIAVVGGRGEGKDALSDSERCILGAIDATCIF